MIFYRQAVQGDAVTIARLGLSLYSPKNTFETLRAETDAQLRSEKHAVFLAFDKDTAVGFCEISIHNDYVEGTNGGSIGYVEGVFVLPTHRGRHIAKELVSLGENWAREKGCTEFASDCKLNNMDSLQFHLKIGFTEAGRNIHFVKKL